MQEMTMDEVDEVGGGITMLGAAVLGVGAVGLGACVGYLMYRYIKELPS